MGEVTIKGTFSIGEEEPGAGLGYLTISPPNTTVIPIAEGYIDLAKMNKTDPNAFSADEKIYLTFVNTPEEIQKITSLTSANNIPCEVVISQYHSLFMFETDAHDSAVLKSFKTLS